jgi:hypothetical protein
MNEQLQNAIQAYGQAQFNLGVATLRLEQAIASLTPVVAQPEPQTEETKEP